MRSKALLEDRYISEFHSIFNEKVIVIDLESEVKMKKYSIISFLLIVLILINHPVKAGVNMDSLIITGKNQLRQAANTWNENGLIVSRSFFERCMSDQTYPWLIHYYIALADYRLVSYHLSEQDKEKALQYIDDGIEHLKKSIEIRNDFAEAYSLLSSFYGNKIGVKPMLGMTLGPKSGHEMSKAMNLEPKNPRNHLIAGQSAYFTPKLFGGGKEKAKKYFKQAIAYFDSLHTENLIYPDWGHEEAYVWLGIYYRDNENKETALKHFKKALEINPDYNWVKYVLIPEIEKKSE